MKSWICIEQCGACCKFDLNERENIKKILTDEDINLINKMTGRDGWCKYLDKKNKKCLIYEKRPHFCRVNEFSKNFREYLKYGDKFLIDCCKQHIESVYGKKSSQLIAYKRKTKNKWKMKFNLKKMIKDSYQYS